MFFHVGQVFFILTKFFADLVEVMESRWEWEMETSHEFCILSIVEGVRSFGLGLMSRHFHFLFEISFRSSVNMCHLTCFTFF